ncbi:MAG: BtrH N-terminal domain-containing protein [Bermanella sp.]
MLIKDTHTPGKHCSSTAIADLVNFHGLPWSEDFCFGVGGGLGISYCLTPEASPSRLLHTRSFGYEKRFFNAIGVHDFAWQGGTSAQQSQADLLLALNENRPALLLTDIYYLHYFNSSSHFPGHGIMAWGYDAHKEIFYVSDTEREQLEEVSFSKMRKARISDMAPFSYQGDFFAPQELATPTDLTSICQQAIHENAARLLNGDDAFSGIQALYTAMDDFKNWQNSADWQWSCRFAYQTIEKRGTGGSGFRKMYARFLSEASVYLESINTLELVAKMEASAQCWFNLSEAFKQTSEQDLADFSNIERCMKEVIKTESEYCQHALSA